MAHDRRGFKDDAFNLPKNTSEPNCDSGAIWTNLTTEELHFCIGDVDQVISHSGYERCSLTKSADQLITKETWTDLTFNQEDYDDGGLHDNSTNNERITVSRAGYYLVSFQIDWQTKKDTDYQARIYKNGNTLVKQICVYSPKDDVDLCMGRAILIKLAANDYITLQGYHGAAVNRNVRSAKTYFQATLIFSEPT